MLEKIAWGLSKFAFDAAQDRRFAVLMRRAFRRLGTLSFRLALHLEGRALAAICEGSAKGAGLGALKGGGLTTLGKHCLWRFSSPAAGTGGNLLPLVQAWSLPNLPQLQKLGLGPVWAVRCPFCRNFHTHLPGEGLRAAVCVSGTPAAAYALGYAGELPRVLHEAFRRSAETWPKVLLEWPRHDQTPSLLEAA
jgi:hypothetical protein